MAGPLEGEGRSLIPVRRFDQRAIYRAGENLTADQLQQISRVTTSYLRDYGLIAGVENVLAVKPVITTLITEGLAETASRRDILPQDNLEKAFRRQYKKRKDAILTAQSFYPRISEIDAEESALAIPTTVLVSSKEELDSQITRPDTPTLPTLVDLVQTRRPIFTQMLTYARERVEELIPGSKQVEITPQQSGSLVRNLIFSLIVYGRPKPLLDTDEVVVNKDEYIKALAEQQEEVIARISSTLGISSSEGKAYATDLTDQILHELSRVDTASVASLEGIRDAHKKLSHSFMLGNPFYRIEISEDPQEQGKSMWDPEHSFTITINGIEYRIPRIATLEFMEFTNSINDPAKSTQLREAIEHINRLQSEIAMVDSGNETKSIEDKIKAARVQVDIVSRSLSERRIPEMLVASPDELKRQREEQLAMFDEEDAIFSYSRALREKIITTALPLLSKYMDGRRLDNLGDETEILQLYFESDHLFRILRGFERYRVRDRIQAMQNFCQTTDREFYISGIPSERNRRTQFERAITLNFLDLRQFQTELWMRNSYLLENLYRPEEKMEIFEAILEQEKREIETALLAEVPSEQRQEILQTTGGLVESGAYKLYIKKNEKLKKRVRQYLLWSGYASQGSLPTAGEQAVNNRFKTIHGFEDEAVHRAVVAFAPKSMRIDETDDDGILMGRQINTHIEEHVEKRLRTNEGPAYILTKLIAETVPEALIPDFKPTLESIANGIIPNPYLMLSKPERLQASARIKERFLHWLAFQGIVLSPQVSVLPAATNFTAEARGVLVGTLDGIESDVKTWHEIQRKGLERYNVEKMVVLTTHPVLYKQEQQIRANKFMNELQEKKRKQGNTLESRVRKLSGLGVVLPESTFKTSHGDQEKK